MKRLGLVIATAGGAGYTPVAPGTAGSAVGVLLYFAIRQCSLVCQASLLIVLALVGIWAGSVAAKHFDRKDPGQVVIDEVVGQAIVLFGLHVGLLGALLGFLAFRALDIVKPWPARQFERFPGGLGIMADDVMAGVYGSLLMHVVLYVRPGGW